MSDTVSPEDEKAMREALKSVIATMEKKTADLKRKRKKARNLPGHEGKR